MTDTLGRSAARGAMVTVGAQLLRMAVQLASVIILARLLGPEDYGLVAMVLAVVGVGEILRDFGLSSAAVQAATLSDRQRTSLFWINSAIGAGLAILVFSCAPLLAAVYDRAELIDIARMIAPVFLLNGLTTQYRASLVRALRFTTLARADVLAAVIGLAVAIAVAAAGSGYVALVLQQLVQATALLVLLAVPSRWLPGLPRRDTPVRELLGFGSALVGAQLVGYVANNVDSVIIGLRLGAAPLGIYSRAFQLLMTPLGQIRSPITSVALPVLSRLSDERDRFVRFIGLGQLALGYTMVAALGLVIAAAEPLTALLLGDRWLEAAPVLRLLAVAGVFQTLAFVGYWVYLARGLTADLLRYSLVSAAIKVTCVVVGSQWGLVGVAVGYAIAPALSWPVSLWWLSRRSGLPVRGLYGGATRILSAVSLAAAAGWSISVAANPIGDVAQIALALAAGAAVYAALALVPVIRRDYRDLAALARHLRRRTASATPSTPPDASRPPVAPPLRR